MNQFQPRYDEEKGIYRDCKWCHGKGCLACPGEAAKEYEANGPKLVGTFPNTPEGVDAAMKLAMSLLPQDRLPANDPLSEMCSHCSRVECECSDSDVAPDIGDK